jgi:hypothetical protein
VAAPHQGGARQGRQDADDRERDPSAVLRSVPRTRRTKAAATTTTFTKPQNKPSPVKNTTAPVIGSVTAGRRAVRSGLGRRLRR